MVYAICHRRRVPTPSSLANDRPSAPNEAKPRPSLRSTSVVYGSSLDRVHRNTTAVDAETPPHHRRGLEGAGGAGIRAPRESSRSRSLRSIGPHKGIMNKINPGFRRINKCHVGTANKPPTSMHHPHPAPTENFANSRRSGIFSAAALAQLPISHGPSRPHGLGRGF